MLEKVTAYKLPSGQSHPDKLTAAAYWLQSLANAGWDHELDITIAKRMIDKREQIIKLLQSIDEDAS